MTDKQILERYYAEPILKHLNVEEKVIPSDSPDMLLDTEDGAKVGIEVVQSFPIEGKDGRYNKIRHRVSDACQAYEEKLEAEGRKGLLVWVSFLDEAYRHTVTYKRFKEVVMKEIPLKCEQWEIEENLSVPAMRNLYLERMTNGYFNTKYVDSASISLVPNWDGLQVTPVRTGYYLPIAEESVISCIKKKEGKLANYKLIPENKDIQAYWLFICNPSGAFCDLEGFKAPPVESSFDRIYITDGKKVLQLK